MHGLFWVLVLIFTFGFGLWAARALGHFIDNHRKAFPIKRRFLVKANTSDEPERDFDGTCVLCYNRLNPTEETLNHEKCDP